MPTPRVIIALACALLLTPALVHAATMPVLPTQLGGYTLQPLQSTFDSACSQDYWGKFCQEYWRAEYSGKRGARVTVYLRNVTAGADIYLAFLAAKDSAKVSGATLYRDEPGNLTWMLASATSSGGYALNSVTIRETTDVKNVYGGITYDASREATGDNDVAAYFLKNFPPGKLVAASTTDLKGATITVTAPGSGKTLYAGEPFTIKWKSKKVPKEAKVLFQLAIKRDAASPETETGIGDSSQNGGTFEWTVPAEYAYGEKDDKDNLLYRVRAVVSSFSGQVAAEDYSDSFRIISKTPGIAAVKFASHTEGERWTQADKVSVTWWTLPHATSYRLYLVKDGQRAGRSIARVAAGDPSPTRTFDWTPGKKTKPGSYHFLVEAYTGKDTAGKGTSETFEIAE